MYEYDQQDGWQTYSSESRLWSVYSNTVSLDTEMSGIWFYEGESTSNQPNLFPVEIHLFFFDGIAL